MPFFSSLTHTGTRVGGQEEIATQYFEAGCPEFPTNYPCTEAYAAYVEARGKEDRERWERKPPAKRPNWEKLGTDSPWIPDWPGVLGLRKTETEAGRDGSADLVATQREPQSEAGEGQSSTQKTVEEESNKGLDMCPWLLRGAETLTLVEILSHSPDPAADLFAKFNALRAKRSLSPMSSPVGSFFQNALLNVRLSIPRSGSPEDNAVIYKMDDEEAKKWRSLTEQGEEEFSETQV